MSNILFNNLDRLATIGKFLLYDRLVSADIHNGELETQITFKGEVYRVRAKVTKVRYRK